MYICDTLIADSFHVVTIDIWAFVPLWHRDLYPVIEKINVSCLWPGDDNLLYIGYCCKSFASRFWRSRKQKLVKKGFFQGKFTWAL